MIDDASPEPHVSGTPSARAPESCFWPLVALVLVILPQVLVRTRLREGPRLVLSPEFGVHQQQLLISLPDSNSIYRLCMEVNTRGCAPSQPSW
jgi:hypothetical protein